MYGTKGLVLDLHCFKLVRRLKTQTICCTSNLLLSALKSRLIRQQQTLAQTSVACVHKSKRGAFVRFNAFRKVSLIKSTADCGRNV